MKKQLVASIAFSLALGAATLSADPARAQDNYPTKPITVIVPFTAGGPTDTVARLVAEPMSRTLGQQIVVQNVGGAGGTLGVGQAVNAAPDGYTLVLHHIGMSTAPTLYRNLPFDPQEALAPIGLVTDVPMVFVARKDFPPNTFAELIDYVKENADSLTYGNAGIGAASHLCGMLFMDSIKTQVTTVPYQGAGPALTDLVGGQIDFMCDQTTNTTGQIKAGAIKAYAVTTADRVQSLPDLPTAAESGLPAIQVGVWHGLYAPAGTPEPIIAKLSDALQKALQDQTVITRFAELGTAPAPQEDATPKALGDLLASQIELWRPIIQAAGVYAD